MEAVFRQKLKLTLEMDLPYSERRLLAGGRAAAVLALLGFSRAGRGDPAILITRRTDSVGQHKGQMAFPGGMSEPDELVRGPEGMVATAIRETYEEIGILPETIEVVGALPELTTITDYRVTPVVGLLRQPIEDFRFALNQHEIAEALWVPLRKLHEPGVYRVEHVRVGQVDYPVHVYLVDEYRIWGATGAMLRNLMERLERHSLPL